MGKSALEMLESIKIMRVVLASKSPRRREILENLGLKFDIVVADADERCDEKDPERRVAMLASIKGRAALDMIEDKDDLLIIASDTLVYALGEFLGKPRDREDAERMMRLLSGRAHSVVSGLYLWYNGREYSSAAATRVIFDEMCDDEIESYISTDEPYDKAGGYAVQGLASLYVKGIEGDYFNVVGLPVNMLYKALKNEFGIDIESLKV